MWFLIISLVAILIAAVLGLGGGLVSFLDRHANVLDNQYIPVIPEDMDRHTIEQLKKKFEQGKSQPLDPKTIEELRKKIKR